ncbi:MAG: hypothetical protein ACYS0H_07990 [Planctomycetota bacterium]|jgi:hypothetical protein
MKPTLLHIVLCAAVILCIGNTALGQSIVDSEPVLKATIAKTIEGREEMSAFLGDVLCVKLVVENPYTGPVLVVDNLHSAFTYMPGTCMLDGVCVTPTLNGNRISMLVGAGSHEISFMFQVVQVEAYNTYISNVAEVHNPDSNVDDEDCVIIKLCRFKIHKWLWSHTHPGIMPLPMGEEIGWVMEIRVVNTFPFIMQDVVVKDNLAAELEVDGYSAETGEVELETKGKSKKVKLTWTVGTLFPGSRSSLRVYVSTDLNPAGKQEYTSPGCYELNSGSVVKFKDPLTGNQLSAHTGSVRVYVGTAHKN